MVASDVTGRSLRERFPLLAAQYCERRNPLRAHEIAYSFTGEVWWHCEQGHHWTAKLYNRTKSGYLICPVCSGRLVQPGVNDFLTLGGPRLLAQVDWSRTSRDRLRGLHPRSKESVAWRCPRGHQWEEQIYNRARGTGCPHCSGKRLLWSDSLEATHPHLAKEWHESNERKASSVTAAWRKQALWRCPRGHAWTCSVFARVQGAACSVCAHQKVLTGFNDLGTMAPEIAEELGIDNAFDASEALHNSSSVALWRCSVCGHGWRASVRSRAVLGRGCPQCRRVHRSALEDEVVNYVATLLKPQESLVRGDRTLLGGREIDIYLPERRLGLELNGDFWHSEAHLLKTLGETPEERHGEKLRRAREASIALGFLWEHQWLHERVAAKTALREFVTSGAPPPSLLLLRGPGDH